MKALIADDESLARSQLRGLLTETGRFGAILEAVDGPAAVRAIDSVRPDVVFLDIEMPELNGIDVVRKVTHRPAFIFTTAHDEYAVTAFELCALDYLLKPFGRDRLKKALDRLDQLPDRTPINEQIDSLTASSDQTLSRIFIRQNRTVTPISISDVERFESRGDYVGVWVNGKRHLLAITLRDLERRLDTSRFVRIHRSHVVNFDFVAGLTSCPDHRLCVTMRDGTELMASRSQSRNMRQRFQSIQ